MNSSNNDSRTQELKILALVDRGKWLMHVETIIPRTGMQGHRTPGGGTAIHPLCPRGSASNGDGIWAIASREGMKVMHADKEFLSNR